ncbi:aminotransferase class I/II-fold pyridoxal phosphate-dependent enzyme [Paenibacillus aquistagni]|uniref:aminotransferase class I/II-fold pyridoxal phosphate-dependent enzyme n=1 Tax=Paenibacillus aquistagni TaxID=1852522 RepID=UPI00145B05B9|nr:aminotransferase class I/II-fold pyridoxal phosphate-dependent enzyme [Paenibacillus aquistagni]NMM53128.1 aminotransferase class I/II-fold pyridoxal phosphate-dependent enzyme [Paenibacillus aquistagni]
MSVADRISPHVRAIPPSGIRQFFDYASGSANVISLGVGEPDFKTPEHIRQAGMRALSEGVTKYTPNAGLMELREEISNYMSCQFGLSYDPEGEILVTVGSSEAVDLALRMLIAPGDEILIPAPSYVAYSPITALHGGKVIEVESSVEQQFKLTADALTRAITPRSKVLILNYPSNPTGTVMFYEDWLPIAEVIKAHNLIVISDEIYAELTYDQRHISIASLPGMKERTIVLNGFSKAFSMTGWRVGYACGPQVLLAEMLKIHQYIAMCAPTVSQVAAIEALRHGMEEKERMKEAFKERRTRFVKGLRELGLTCHEPEGTFYAFPSITRAGMSSEAFALKLLKEADVAVVPGHVFGTGGEGFIRCSFATSLDRLEAALERMARFVKLTVEV